MAATDQAAARGEVAECVVVKVVAEHHESVVDGGLDTTLHHHTLRCPGGYPVSLAEDRRLAPDGGTLRVAYDPRRRVEPAVEGSTSPWLPASRRAHAVRRHGGGAARQPSREPSGSAFTGSAFTGSAFARAERHEAGRRGAGNRSRLAGGEVGS
ncbi:hypothetical protein STANM309S_01955 [Streptomyces tanashiensis]